MGIETSPQSFSTKLVLWQFDALRRNPLEGVNAAPLESNIFDWHGNFYFPEDHDSYPGMSVHFMLQLPRDFPNSTPSLTLLTSFDHSHVFGGEICFSLLREFEWHFHGMPNTVFWNPSRSIRSLLESVYVFLTVDEDSWSNVSKTRSQQCIRDSQQRKCWGCAHHPAEGKVWPAEEDWFAARTGASATPMEQSICSLAMHQDLTTIRTTTRIPAGQQKTTPTLKPIQYKSRFSVTEISSNTGLNGTSGVAVAAMSGKSGVAAAAMSGKSGVAAAATSMARNREQSDSASFDQKSALMKAKADEMMAMTNMTNNCDGSKLASEANEDFKCSISGVGFDHSDKVVMGFGVYVVRRQDGSIESITTDLSPISMEIFFKGKIRKSCLGSPMTHFFPFAINEGHWKRAKQVIFWCVDAIIKGGPEHMTVGTQEDRLLFVVGELWKSMAVLMMKGGTHASEKVLKGFCSLHHILLLAASETDPVLDGEPVLKVAAASATKESTEGAESWTKVVHRGRARVEQPGKMDSELLQLANGRVRNFVRFPRMRHKAQCPDFGRFLPLILLSSVGWKEIQQPFIGELLARGARWICKDQPSLATVKQAEMTQASARAEISWKAHPTGLKLTAFQVRFALNVVPWARDALPREVVAAYELSRRADLMVRAMYNLLGGRPTPEMLSKFQAETKKIEALSSFKEFFRIIDMPRSDMDIQLMLCRAMEDSARFGYHRHRV